jgi:hypothetical protein
MVAGAVVERGILSPYMVTDEAKMEAQYENPASWSTGRNVLVPWILPILEKIAGSHGHHAGRVIAEGIEADALPSLVLNNNRASSARLCIKAPGLAQVSARSWTTWQQPPAESDRPGYRRPGRGTARLCRPGQRKVIATRDKTTFMGLEENLRAALTG